MEYPKCGLTRTTEHRITLPLLQTQTIPNMVNEHFKMYFLAQFKTEKKLISNLTNFHVHVNALKFVCEGNHMVIK